MTQAKNVAMHLCVCLITLILPLIICNLSNLSLYRATWLEDDDTWRALCVMQAERAHLQFIPDSLKSSSYFWNSWILILSVSVGGICMFIYLCVSRHFPVYVRHTFIISLFLYFPALR